MKTKDHLALTALYITADDCHVDVPNEFMTLFCRRCPDGTARCTSWSNWNNDAPPRPSPQARAEAESVAAQAIAAFREKQRAA